MVSVNECNGRTLAFLGDAERSLIVRRSLVESGEEKGKRLQKLTISYVSAKAQASFYDALHAEGFFTEAEEEIYRRGRNGSEGAVPRNTDVQTYRMSTGFEAVLGALALENNETRIREIWEKVRSLER
jgi:ribonuclease-3 family protein